MTRVFADTSYFLALLAPRDLYRDIALQWASTVARKVVTTEYVLMEVGNHLSSVALRGICSEFLESILLGSEVKVIPASDVLFRRALDLFQSRPDKSWSLTDCASFVVMRDEGLAEALTFDKHFEQAGFASALK